VRLRCILAILVDTKNGQSDWTIMPFDSYSVAKALKNVKKFFNYKNKTIIIFYTKYREKKSTYAFVAEYNVNKGVGILPDALALLTIIPRFFFIIPMQMLQKNRILIRI
jgi:hypothetical protein